MSGIVSKQDAQQVLKLAFDDEQKALRVLTSGAAGEQEVVQSDGSKLHVTVDSMPVTGAATEDKQDDQIALLEDIKAATESADTKLSDVATATKQDEQIVVLESIESSLSGLSDVSTGTKQDEQTEVLEDIEIAVGAVTTALSDVATATNQATEISHLSDIEDITVDIKTSIDTFAAKTKSADVTEAYDYKEFAYVTSGNGTGQIETITYKIGGASGTTVAVQTLAYDNQDRLVSITKS